MENYNKTNRPRRRITLDDIDTKVSSEHSNKGGRDTLPSNVRRRRRLSNGPPRTPSKSRNTTGNRYTFLNEDDDKEYNKRRRKKIIKRTILFVILAIILIGSIVGVVKFYKPIKEIIADANKIKSEMSREDFELASNTHIYDSSDKEMFTVSGTKNIEYLKFDEIPEKVFECFIAVEDVRFFNHGGIDFKSLARAGVSMIKNHGHISQGGSTITQQLVKLTYLTTEQTYKRKLKEMIIALEVEKKFTKEEILEYYVNNIYYGNNAYGINSAALEYFNQPVKDLSLSQIAYLCAIPNSPNLYDPYKLDEDGENKNTLKRRDLFLDKLLEHGYITREEHDTAKEEKIKLERGDNTSKSFDSRKGFVEKEAVELLMQQNGFEFKYWFKDDGERQNYITNYNDCYKVWRSKFYKKGYKVYTSFNEELQSEVQAKVDEDLSKCTEQTEEGIYKRQVAAITVDNKTGLILTMVGGRTSPKTDYLNRAYNVQRQNGSTMKPLAVYAPACDILNYVPSTTEVDEEIKNGPKNSEGYYSGTVTIREALRQSINTVAWKTEQKVTPMKSLTYLKNMKFEYLVPADNSLALALGGMTVGTNVQEVAGGYSTLANEGKFNKPSCIVKIMNSSDELVYQRKTINDQVYSESTSAIVTDMLKTVATSGTGANAPFNQAIEVAGKTGTTDDNKDLWFAGYSPKYTTVVWTGYDQPQKFTTSGSDSPVIIWRDIMKIMHKDGAACKFDYGDVIKWVNINAEGKEVPQGTEGSRMEIFPKNFTVEKGIINHDSDVDAIKKTLDGILDGANKNPNDQTNLTTQLNNVKVVLKKADECELSDKEKLDIQNYANTIIKQIQGLKLNKSKPIIPINDNDVIPGSEEKSDNSNTQSNFNPNTGVSVIEER